MQAQPQRSLIPSLILDHLDLMECPSCRGTLCAAPEQDAVTCSSCGEPFGNEDGIPLFFWGDGSGVTDRVRAFYEETPFPNYDDIESEWSLRQKAEERVLARQLDRELPRDAKVIEIGCGTGQLSNYLGLGWNRSVWGADMCLNSLRLANAFKRSNQIENVAFLQMNLMHPVFKPGTFDLVICNGVLMTTDDSFAGFRSISQLVRPGGYILIGLYNRYGRLPTDARRLIFRLFGDRFQFLDPHLRDPDVSEAQKRAWFMDQYRHPHEGKHTIGQILGWFDRCGFEFVNGVPKTKAFASFAPGEALFQHQPRGGALDRFLVQAGMLARGGREGGFFTMIGRRTG